MNLTVYIVEKNEQQSHVFHKNKCYYASEKIIDIKAYYLPEVAFEYFLKVYPNVVPCRYCCKSWAQKFFSVSINTNPISFGIEGWLHKRKKRINRK